MKWHPGIRIDKIPVTANIGGLIFVIGIVVLGIVGVPVPSIYSVRVDNIALRLNLAHHWPG